MVLFALVWILVAIAGWIFTRPSESEAEAMTKITTSDLLLLSHATVRRSALSPDEEGELRGYRRRLLATGTVLLLPALMVVIFGRADHDTPELQTTAPVVVPAEVEAAEEKPKAKKQLVRTYLRDPDSSGPPIIVEEFREETLEEKRDPIRLYGTAKVKPLYDNEQLLGITISKIQPDSFWDMVGFRDGDFVIEANGEIMDNPNTSVAFMNSLERAPEVIVRVRGTDGEERTLLYSTPRE
jgi:hypothetical protein